MKKHVFLTMPRLCAAALVVMGIGATTLPALIRGLAEREVLWHGVESQSRQLIGQTITSPDGTYSLQRHLGTTWAIDLDSGETLWTSDGMPVLRDALVSEGGERLVLPSSGSVYNGRTGLLVRQGDAETRRPFHSISADGTRLFYNTATGLGVCDTDSGEVLFEGDVDRTGLAYRDFRFSADGNRVAGFESAVGRFVVIDLDAETITEHEGIELEYGGVRATLSPNLDLIAYNDYGLGVHVHEFPSGEPVSSIPLEYPVHLLAFQGDGTLLVVSGEFEERTRDFALHEVATGDLIDQWSRPVGRLASVYTRDGETGIVEWNGEGLEWRGGRGELLASKPYHVDLHMRALPFNNGADYLLLDTRRNFAVVDTATGETSPWEQFPHGFAYYSLHVAKNSNLAVYQAERSIFSLNLDTGGESMALLHLGQAEVGTAGLSDDGNVAIVGSIGRESIDVVDPRIGQHIRTLAVGEPFYATALSPTGGHAAFFLRNHVSVLDVETGEQMARVDYPSPEFSYERRNWPAISMCVSGDGKWVAVYTPNTVLWLIDVEAGTRDWVNMAPPGQWQLPQNEFLRNHVVMEFSPDALRLLVSPRALEQYLGRVGFPHVGSVLIDLRTKDAVREFFAAPEDVPFPGVSSESVLDQYRLTEARFFPGARTIIGIGAGREGIFTHQSGIGGDNLIIARENLLARPIGVPATARGVDVSGDGVLDAADLVLLSGR